LEQFQGIGTAVSGVMVSVGTSVKVTVGEGVSLGGAVLVGVNEAVGVPVGVFVGGTNWV